MIIGGEVDGCHPKSKSYVEMKTAKASSAELSPDKSMRWWLQSHLIGTEKILCGFRKDNKSGIVKRIKWFEVKKLSKKKYPWSPKICINSLHFFLDFVKKQNIDEYQPYYLKREPGSDNFTFHKDCVGKYRFLPMWLLDHQNEI